MNLLQKITQETDYGNLLMTIQSEAVDECVLDSKIIHIIMKKEA